MFVKQKPTIKFGKRVYLRNGKRGEKPLVVGTPLNDTSAVAAA